MPPHALAHWNLWRNSGQDECVSTSKTVKNTVSSFLLKLEKQNVIWFFLKVLFLPLYFGEKDTLYLLIVLGFWSRFLNKRLAHNVSFQDLSPSFMMFYGISHPLNGTSVLNSTPSLLHKFWIQNWYLCIKCWSLRKEMWILLPTARWHIQPPERGVRSELMRTATAIPPKVYISHIPQDMGKSKQGWECSRKEANFPRG